MLSRSSGSKLSCSRSSDKTQASSRTADPFEGAAVTGLRSESGSDKRVKPRASCLRAS